MKLATLRDGTRDGRLIVVKKDGSAFAPAGGTARTLQAALDDWNRALPELTALAEGLEQGELDGTALDPRHLLSPLPRAYEWIDGAAFLNHVILVRKARKTEPPATLRTDPLVYQGGSSDLLAPREDIPLADEAWGLDFEGEVAVIPGGTRRGTIAADAGREGRLVTLVNDITLPNLRPPEIEKGFGVFPSKPAPAVAPFSVTPHEP